MKKLLLSVAMAAVGVMSLAAGTSAYADTCQVGYTGPDSRNICTSTTTQSCVVTNDNTVDVDGTNVQLSSSGSATSGGNTSGGTAQSGSATNTNGTTINVTVTNPGSCTVTRSVPATPSAPSSPGTGAGKQTQLTANKPVVAPKKATANVLPNTSNGSQLPALLGLIGALGLTGLAVRGGVAVYSRVKS